MVCECSSFQLEDAEALRPRVRGLSQPRPRPPRPPSDRARSTWRRSCGSSPARETTTSPSTTATSRRCAGRDLGGCARRIRFCAGADPDCEVSLSRRDDLRRRRAADRRLRAAARRRRTTSPTRWPPPPRRCRWALDREAVREGLRDFRRLPHRLELVAERRRRQLLQRLQGDQRERRRRGAQSVRRRRARDPRRPAQGRALRRPRRAGPRALPRPAI